MRLCHLDPPIEEIQSFRGNEHITHFTHSYKNLLYRLYYFAKSWIGEISYFISSRMQMVYEWIKGKPIEYVNPSSPQEWKERSQGLYLLIHGINARPGVWHRQIRLLREKTPQYDIKAPYVFKKGHCPLEEALTPIESMVRDYIAKNQGKPIAIMGVSNGARLALHLEERLRDTPSTIFVSSIASAALGTKRINSLASYQWIQKCYHPSLIRDMHYQSESAKRLLQNIREEFPRGVKRTYTFYGSKEDFQIRPYTASFPLLPGKETNYFLVRGENHNSIIQAIAPHQTQKAIEWMEGQRAL